MEKQENVRPFSFEEAKEQIGKAVENKSTKIVTTINAVWPNGMVMVASNVLSPMRLTALLEKYIFLDGSPCGVVE